MKILGLVPARGGSKGIRRKNTKALAGKPLLQWTVESALRSELLDRLVLSTEDDDIADLGSSLGLEVPFRRPATLAADDAAMIDVVLHALDVLESQGYVPDAVAVLQPTSPLRRPEHIGAAAELLDRADAVCGVVAVPEELCPHYVMRVQPDGTLAHFLPEGATYQRRQDVPRAYSRDGTIYLVRQDVARQGSLYGERCLPLFVDPRDSLSIDDEADWQEAERRLTERADVNASEMER